MKLAERYDDEKLAPHWNVDDTPESFQCLMNHITSTTNFKAFFEKEISHPELFRLPRDMVVADIGAGIGWTSALLALKPEVKKVFAVEPSKARLSRIPFVAKHFGVPEGKIVCIDGHFEDFKVPERVHLVCLSSSFHHCFDEQMPLLFNNLRNILIEQTAYSYNNYLSENVTIQYRGKVLLASEHYVPSVNKRTHTYRYFRNIAKMILKPSRYDPDIELFKFKKRDPDPWGGDHYRTKQEIERLISDGGFKMQTFLHAGNIIYPEKWDSLSNHCTYYYAILEML
jgi:SAM-dependent methyltransferase|tara:strand:- start:941 stop:1792 length:852 start_codon:yes stop_codon:yes gene_type:complete